MTTANVSRRKKTLQRHRHRHEEEEKKTVVPGSGGDSEGGPRQKVHAPVFNVIVCEFECPFEGNVSPFLLQLRSSGHEVGVQCPVAAYSLALQDTRC